MQTFLPYPDFEQCARVLDFKRLGKHRLEAKQILETIHYDLEPWSNHPAVKMWRGHKLALAFYYNTILYEWIQRGYKNTMRPYILHSDPSIPAWITPALCLSHQSNLIRKLPEHYRPIFGPDVPDNLPYVWPVS